MDDPFLPTQCYLDPIQQSNANVTSIIPKYGGHVGFVQIGNTNTVVEKFITAQLEYI